MEAKTLHHEEKYRLITEHTSDLIAITTFAVNPVYTYISPSHKRAMGYAPEDLIGKPSLDLIHPDDKKKLLPLLIKYLNQKVKGLLTGKELEISETVQFRARDKSGNWHYLESTVNLVQDELLFVSRDVTERNRSEHELRESTRFLSNILSSIQDGISILDRDMNVLMVNPIMKLWYSHAIPLVGRKCYEIFHGRSGPCSNCPACHTLATGNPGHAVVPLMGADGVSTGWLDLFSFPLRDVSTGDFVGIIEYARDITAHKKADESLRASEQKLRSIMEHMPDGIVLTDELGTIIEWNRGMELITGRQKEHTLGRPLWDVQYEMANPEDKTPAYREQLKSLIMGILHTGKSPLLNTSSEKELLRPDGTRRLMQVLIFIIQTNTGFLIGSIGRDITNQKLMEKEMQKVEKLESLGILAGGIAHDFNNILTAILGNVSLAKMSSRVDEKTLKRLTDAEKACERARDLTQQLLTFAKGGAPIKKTVAVADLIRETAGFALRGSNVRSEINIADDLWAVDVDGGQISQVIHNLIINADQSMPQGGILSLRAENVYIDSKKAVPLSEGKYIAISIADEGVGIPKEYVAKIFDPFFTTKQKGSGLGLATAYSIINNHGGYIMVESTPGRGSTFTFYLPASEKKLKSTNPVPETIPTGKGKILVMDDEEIIRTVARDILNSLGYETHLACDGAEALDLYCKAKETGQAYAAVIMDLTIPGGMGGEEAVKKLLAVDPEAKVIVSSGYATGPIMSNFKAYGFSGVITKPYRIAEIGATLQLVLNGKST